MSLRCLLVPASLALSLSACSMLGSQKPQQASLQASPQEPQRASLQASLQTPLQVLKAPFQRSQGPDLSLIAENLVDSLVQLPNLNPSSATLQLTPSKTRFAQSVEDEIVDRGYVFERVDGEIGLNRVVPQIRKVKTDAGESTSYRVSVGQVSVERQYALVENKTQPVSEQVIRGTREQRIELNDAIFDLPAENDFSQVTFEPYEGPDIDDMLSPPQASALSWFNRGDASVPIKKNMYETMESNYRNLFSGYEDVDQSILVFPNDSLRLGELNKNIIEHYVAMMDPETDVLSVIGCSHGKTEINNGNSLLAVGRANRVKEALMFSGLEHDRILEEGCWAPRLFDEVMPRRGVVLTLKRQKAS